jgi:hypothetical protein
MLTITPDGDGAELKCEFFDENGQLFYSCIRCRP